VEWVHILKAVSIYVVVFLVPQVSATRSSDVKGTWRLRVHFDAELARLYRA
jgi:hypothetical protein